MKNLHPQKNTKNGFTLIEAIVSITIFIVVMVVAATALLSIINANKESHEIKTVMDNLNFSLDDMVRGIRVGDNYSCGNSLTHADSPTTGTSPEACSSFTFSSPYDNGDTITYSAGSVNGCPSTAGQITKQDDTDNACPAALTDPQVHVTGLNFYVLGAEPGASDGEPQVIITAYGYAAQGNDRASFDIQTSVTQRLYDQ